MKIDSTKSEHQSSKEKQVNDAVKTRHISSFASNDPNLLNQTNAQKDFASILKNATNQNEQNLDEKNLSKDIDKSNINESENESKNILKDKDKVHQEKKDNQNSDENTDSKEEKSFAQATLNNQQKLGDITILSARAIIHVADLERIISTIRSQTVANGKQVTIELKRSVLQGLMLKLTIGKDKSVVAELIATNEKVKSQLNAKADELANILKDRGVKLTKLELSLSSDTNDKENRDSENLYLSNSTNKSSKTNDLANLIDTTYSNKQRDSNTSYQI